MDGPFVVHPLDGPCAGSSRRGRCSTRPGLGDDGQRRDAGRAPARQAVVRQGPRDHARRERGVEEQLLIDAFASTAAQLETIRRKFRAVQRLSKKEQREIDEDRHVRRRDLDDGMVRIEATLRPEEAAIVMAAIEQHAKALAAARLTAPPDVSAETQRAQGSASVSAETQCRWDGRPVQYDLVVGGLARLDGLRGPANRAIAPPLNA